MATNAKEPAQDSPLAKKLFPIYQVLATIGVSMCSGVTGFSSGYSGPALSSLQKENEIRITEDDKSWIGSVLPLCSIAGSIAAGFSINYLGRKSTLLASCPPFVFAYLLIAFAKNVALIITGRAVAGFCVGLVTVVFPVYLSEALDPAVRGRLGIMPTVFGNGAMVLAFAVGSVLNWSWLALFGAFFSVPFVIIMMFVPETPRWYVSKGKMEKAKSSAQKLRGEKIDVSEELEELVKVHDKGTGEGNKTKSIIEKLKDLRKRRYLLPLSICLCLMVFQQLCGINAFLFYVVEIFEIAGSSVDANTCSIIVGAVNLCATLMASALIDKVGRKILLYASFSLMVAVLILFGVYFYAKENGSDVSHIGWLPLVCLVLYVIGFSSGAGPIPWLMMGELLPDKIRNSGASIVTCFNLALSFAVSKTYHDLLELIKPYGTIWLYAAITLVGIIFVFFFVPETRGKTLEEIQKRFETTNEGPDPVTTNPNKPGTTTAAPRKAVEA